MLGLMLAAPLCFTQCTVKNPLSHISLGRAEKMVSTRAQADYGTLGLERSRMIST